MTYQPPGDPNQNPYQPGQYPPPEPTTPMGGQSGWPDPYQAPDPYGQPPTSGPAYGQPTSGQPYGQPTSGQPYGQQPGGFGPGGPGMPPPPPGGFTPGAPPPSSGGNGAMIGIIIAVVAVLILAVGIGGFFLIRGAANDSADGGDESTTSESSSSSSEETTSALPSETSDDTGNFADAAQAGDCLDYPTDPNDTKVVDCGDSSAYYEVLERVDSPSTTENTDEAAAAECEGTSFDSTLYLLGSDVADPFVLCLKTL
ncbi:LppU/SCO3897 family protein [Stackebrandtia nassauensis]|nr:hypothetical protein [Stackebrandtia nassauensis]